jgi:hypothetical protein
MILFEANMTRSSKRNRSTAEVPRGNRDEFSPSIKHNLAERVSYRCSNPLCRKPTIGPNSDENKSTSIGVAAHVTAAAEGGKRYDKTLTPSERAGYKNGIWLCAACATLVDRDEVLYTVNKLRQWKVEAEERAGAGISGAASRIDDTHDSPALIVLANQVDRLSSFVSSTTERDYLAKQEAWREGKKADAEDWIREITSDTTVWPSLPESTRAKLLLFQSRLYLDADNPNFGGISAQIESAKKLDIHSDWLRLEALIKHKMGDSSGALALLTDSDAPEAMNLQAAIELEMGHVATSLELLSVQNEKTLDTHSLSEAFRLQALAFLATGNMVQSRFCIGKALEITPLWQTTRATEAIINYFSSLSESALPKRIVSWPEPMQLAFVKLDDDSQERLRRGCEWFRNATENSAIPIRDRKEYRIWKLASLCNTYREFKGASDYGTALVRIEQVDIRIILWILVRNLDVDLEPTIISLKNKIENQSADTTTIISLVACYLKVRKSRQALSLLKRTRLKYFKGDRLEVWNYWHAHSLVANGDFRAATQIAKAMSNREGVKDLSLLSIRAKGCKGNEVGEVMSLFLAAYRQGKDARILYDAFEFALSHNVCSSVVDFAEELVKGLGTAEGLRTAAYAAFQVEKYELCLNLLDNWIGVVPERKLSVEMRRLRGISLYHVSRMPDAVNVFEGIIQEKRTTQDILNLANICFSMGDLKRVGLLAKETLSRPDTTSEQLLGLASMTHLDWPELATELWKKAMRENLHDDLVGLALDLGYRLGLERELGDLIQRMNSLAGEGRSGFKRFSLAEMVSFVRKQNDSAKNLKQAYDKGTLPAQVIVEAANIPLVQLYHVQLSASEKSYDSYRNPYLLARHGGRETADRGSPGRNIERLNLDLTAILLAEHIGLLQELERGGPALRIPHDAVPSLLQERRMLKDHQPPRTKARLEILDSINRGSITASPNPKVQLTNGDEIIEAMGIDWAGLLQAAVESHGFVIDHLPLQSLALDRVPNCIPESYTAQITDTGGIVESLRQSGPLSSAQFQQLLHDFGQDNAQPSVTPPQGCDIFFHANTLEMIAMQGILGLVTERFKVHWEEKESTRLRLELKEIETRERTSDWLKVLIERINAGIQNGIYSTIPSITLPPERESLNVTVAQRSMLALFGCDLNAGDVLWIDDRCLNSYMRKDSCPIIGIYEVLKHLRDTNRITLDTYYRFLGRLRKGNVLFIPTEGEEILFHIKNAIVRDDTLIETEELAVLRRYIATSLLNGRIVQRPQEPDEESNVHNELFFFISVARAVNEALVDLWNEPKSEVLTNARAEWIFANLYINHAGILAAVGESRSAENALYLGGLSLSSLLSYAITLETKVPNTISKSRVQYFDWLFRRVLRRRFEADPYLLHATADALKYSVITRPAIGPEGVPDGANDFLLQRLFEDMPKPVKDELARDSDFMESIGLVNRQAVIVEGLYFDPDGFYTAVAKTVNGEEASTTTVKGDNVITMHPFVGADGTKGCWFLHPGSGLRRELLDRKFALLSPSISERETYLLANKTWLDVATGEFDRIVAEIVAGENQRDRIDRFDQLAHSSVTASYDRLRAKLLNRQNLSWDDLRLPTAARLLDHLKCSDSSTQTRLNEPGLSRLSESLVADLGLYEATLRLICLPIPLSGNLLARFSILEMSEQRRLIKALLRIAGSPLMVIHIIRILTELSRAYPEWVRLRMRLIRGLKGKYAEERYDLFAEILKWSNNEVESLPDVSSLEPATRLALPWLHANKLLMTFAMVGVQVEPLREFMKTRWQRASIDIITRDPAVWFDVAHPRNLTYATFVLFGLSYALESSDSDDVDENVTRFCSAIAGTDSGGIKIPAHGLLLDPIQGKDVLHSLFGGDKGERLRELLDPDLSRSLRHTSLESFAETIVGRLGESPQAAFDWALLRSVLSDFPPYESVKSTLRDIILKTDFAALVKEGDAEADLALMTACQMTRHLDDSGVKTHLTEELFETAAFRGGSEETGKKVIEQEDLKSANALIECVVGLSLSGQTSQEPLAGFAELMVALVDRWPFLGTLMSSYVQRLCEELSLANAHHMWRLLLRIRAMGIG